MVPIRNTRYLLPGVKFQIWKCPSDLPPDALPSAHVFLLSARRRYYHVRFAIFPPKIGPIVAGFILPYSHPCTNVDVTRWLPTHVSSHAPSLGYLRFWGFEISFRFSRTSVWKVYLVYIFICGVMVIVRFCGKWSKVNNGRGCKRFCFIPSFALLCRLFAYTTLFFNRTQVFFVFEFFFHFFRLVVLGFGFGLVAW